MNICFFLLFAQYNFSGFRTCFICWAWTIEMYMLASNYWKTINILWDAMHLCDSVYACVCTCMRFKILFVRDYERLLWIWNIVLANRKCQTWTRNGGGFACGTAWKVKLVGAVQAETAWVLKYWRRFETASSSTNVSGTCLQVEWPPHGCVRESPPKPYFILVDLGTTPKHRRCLDAP